MTLSLIKPIITEKSLTLSRDAWYTFQVSKLSSKKSIATDVAALFNVDVIDVRIVNMTGKTRRVGRKMKHVHKSDWKKAYVQLKKGQTINIFTAKGEESAKK